MASSVDFPRSPLENVLNFVPQGHEKALKHAFYNAAGMAFVLFGVAATAAVYFVLQPFLKPLLWAVLFGSVLHPFKNGMTDILRRWFKHLKQTGTPLTAGIILLPIGIVEYVSQTIGNIVTCHLKAMTTVTVTLAATYIMYICTPQSLLKLGIFFKDILVYHTHDFLGYFGTVWVWSVVIGFLLIVVFYWTPNTNRALRITSIFIWIVMLLNLATILGSYRAPVFVAAVTLMIVGFCKEVNDVRAQYIKLSESEEEEDAYLPSPFQTAWSVLTGAELPDNQRLRNPAIKLNEPSTLNLPPSASKVPLTATSRQASVTNLWGKTESVMSNVYIYSLIWACILVELWTHVWMWPLLALALVYMIIKRLGSHFGVWSFIFEKLHSAYNSALSWLGQRKDALIPAPIRGIGKLILTGDHKMTTVLEQSIDILTTICAILLVIVFVVMATVFLLVQIHAESMHLVQVTSNLINNTVVHNPDVQGMLPEGLSTMLDSMFENAYEYGRELAVKMVKNLINEQDEQKAADIEKQVLDLWDKVYHAWMESGQNASAQVMKENEGMISNIMAEFGAPGLFNLSALIGFVKENVDTFMAVIDASWTVVKGNISLALSALTATLSLLFGGGTVLLNLLFSFFVFVTALFYLLSASGDKYKPVVLFNRLTPGGIGSTGNRFGQAVEEAINSVFAASFKMAFFYGLWTWFIHKLFQVKIVYIPSALAAIFGAMPFLGTFWAVVPAVLDLWLAQGQGMKAIFMFLCQLLPMSCVDTAIYSEIRGGGHPYLTGLAVAGGIFCLGAEGAIIGPILLCCLYVAMKMYTNVMQDSPINEPKRLINKTYLMKRTTSIM